MLQNVRTSRTHPLTLPLILAQIDMPPDDIRAIIGKLSRRPSYITQEIVDTGGSMGGMYTDIGDVQEYAGYMRPTHVPNISPSGSATPRL